jgi:hypothetical protein
MSSFCSVDFFKEQTGITTLTDAVIQNALTLCAERIRSVIFIPTQIKTTQSDTVYLIQTPIADYNMDGKVDKFDINCYELDTEHYNETDRNINILSFKPKWGRIEFTINMPVTSGNYLIIEYYKAVNDNERIQYQLIDFNMIMAVNYLFKTIEFTKLQDGITSWSLNGVSISFDFNTMNAIMEDNNKKIQMYYAQLTPIYTKTTTLGFANDVQRSGANNFTTSSFSSFGNITFK